MSERNPTFEIMDAMLNAHSDGHLASAIQELCEGGLFRTKSGKAFASKLAKLARAESTKQFRIYFAIEAAIKKPEATRE